MEWVAAGEPVNVIRFRSARAKSPPDERSWEPLFQMLCNTGLRRSTGMCQTARLLSCSGL